MTSQEDTPQFAVLCYNHPVLFLLLASFVMVNYRSTHCMAANLECRISTKGSNKMPRNTKQLWRGRGESESVFLRIEAAKRINSWQIAARNGSPSGQFLLGQALREGAGIAKDGTASLEWFRKAANQDFGPATTTLGLYYLSGNGIQTDQKLGLELLRRGVILGCSRAQYNLGVCYRDGIGVEKTPKQQLNVFRRPQWEVIYTPN